MYHHRSGDVLGGSRLIDALNRGWCEPGLCAASVGCGESGSPASLGGVSALVCIDVSAGSRPRPLSSVTRFSIFRTAVAALVWAQPPSSVERNSAYMLCASTSSCHAASGTGAPAVRLPCTDGSARLSHPTPHSQVGGGWTRVGVEASYVTSASASWSVRRDMASSSRDCPRWLLWKCDPSARVLGLRSVPALRGLALPTPRRSVPAEARLPSAAAAARVDERPRLNLALERSGSAWRSVLSGSVCDPPPMVAREKLPEAEAGRRR